MVRKHRPQRQEEPLLLLPSVLPQPHQFLQITKPNCVGYVATRLQVELVLDVRVERTLAPRDLLALQNLQIELKCRLSWVFLLFLFFLTLCFLTLSLLTLSLLTLRLFTLRFFGVRLLAVSLFAVLFFLFFRWFG